MVDPLADQFAHVSPFNYAENRPIDGVDLWGLQWVSAIDGNGNTNINVNVNFKFDFDPNLLPQGLTVSDYQAAISSQFNSTLQASNSKFSGNVTFAGGDSKELGVVVPSLNIYGNKPPEGAAVAIGGMTTFEHSGVNIYKKDGSVMMPNDLAKIAVHELLHTIRFEHPFEKTQGADTKLIHDGGNNYLTTGTTDSKIQYNIMNYGLISIDGQNLGELWKTQSPIYLTNDQLDLMMNEINLQQQGFGTWRNDFYDYWLNTPGTDVPRK